ASGRTLGHEEIEAISEAIRSGVLTSTKGTWVKTLETRFAKNMGVKFAHACSSGTAAIHCAVAAIDPEPGDEIVTSPITDMGALTPIVYQGAVPVNKKYSFSHEGNSLKHPVIFHFLFQCQW
ncbi:MAG: DegT/DnrJ/EryC1/StrS family aminotransferase, partial [Bacteroidota bacterium]|nr:DegT/DnrJ/EryC1/StrS family aminotransferase [Bacteroidota bacterium]